MAKLRALAQGWCENGQARAKVLVSRHYTDAAVGICRRMLLNTIIPVEKALIGVVLESRCINSPPASSLERAPPLGANKNNQGTGGTPGAGPRFGLGRAS
jgi:hypothetical protein